MRTVINLAVLALLLIPAAAQASTSDAEKARVFITDSQSWQMTGNSGVRAMPLPAVRAAAPDRKPRRSSRPSANDALK
jgi:hypothetical protein